MRELLSETIERILADLAPPAAVRAAERGVWPAALWRQVEDAGLVLALRPEALGGSGLGWRDVLPVLVASGRHAAPVPLGEAIAANALAAAAGVALPDGIATLGLFAGGIAADGRARVQARSVPFARDAALMVGTLQGGDRPGPAELLVLRIADARAVAGGEGEGRCDLEWTDASPLVRMPMPAGLSALEAGAALRSAQIAGGIARVLELSVRYAGERRQFGQPIGKFQAVQQQLAVLAELAAASAMAAELACDGPASMLDADRVACAKARTSEAAATAAAIGHAVHGAIGVTEEHDLQLYTRRLWAWRLDFGSVAHWTTAIGARLLAAGGRTVWQDVVALSSARA